MFKMSKLLFFCQNSIPTIVFILGNRTDPDSIVTFLGLRFFSKYQVSSIKRVNDIIFLEISCLEKKSLLNLNTFQS